MRTPFLATVVCSASLAACGLSHPIDDGSLEAEPLFQTSNGWTTAPPRYVVHEGAIAWDGSLPAEVPVTSGVVESSGLLDSDLVMLTVESPDEARMAIFQVQGGLERLALEPGDARRFSLYDDEPVQGESFVVLTGCTGPSTFDYTWDQDAGDVTVTALPSEPGDDATTRRFHFAATFDPADDLSGQLASERTFTGTFAVRKPVAR